MKQAVFYVLAAGLVLSAGCSKKEEPALTTKAEYHERAVAQYIKDKTGKGGGAAEVAAQQQKRDPEKRAAADKADSGNRYSRAMMRKSLTDLERKNPGVLESAGTSVEELSK